MSDFEFSDDSSEDPPIDQELRAFIQDARVQPTAAEKSRFWDDLTQKLPEQSNKNFFSRLPVKVTVPLAAACGMIVLLIVLPLKQQPGQMATLTPSQEFSQLDAAPSLRNRSEIAKQKPMVLGAAREPSDAFVRPSFLSENLEKELQPLALEWERLSVGVYHVHVPLKHYAGFQASLKHWPEKLLLTSEPVVKKKNYKTYRVELKTR